MDQHTLTSTRRSLHGVAEYVLAGPQFARSGDIRLRVTASGISTVAEPSLLIEADALVAPGGRLALSGTIASLASRAGVEARDLRDVYAAGPTIGLDDAIAVDLEAADMMMGAFARGDAAMRLFGSGEEPVLWPEHFDVGIAVDEVNYGVSPGDDRTPEPYAYVGPWTAREGTFWNADFGAYQLMRDLPARDDVLAFFAEGARRAVDDPVAG